MAQVTGEGLSVAPEELGNTPSLDPVIQKLRVRWRQAASAVCRDQYLVAGQLGCSIVVGLHRARSQSACVPVRDVL